MRTPAWLGTKTTRFGDAHTCLAWIWSWGLVSGRHRPRGLRVVGKVRPLALQGFFTCAPRTSVHNFNVCLAVIQCLRQARITRPHGFGSFKIMATQLLRKLWRGHHIPNLPKPWNRVCGGPAGAAPIMMLLFKWRRTVWPLPLAAPAVACCRTHNRCSCTFRHQQHSGPFKHHGPLVPFHAVAQWAATGTHTHTQHSSVPLHRRCK